MAADRGERDPRRSTTWSSTSRSPRASCSRSRSARSRRSTASRFDLHRGRDARHRRRVRLRQVDAGPAADAAGDADRRRGHASRARTSSKLSGGELRRLRRNIQMVIQDPYTSLNPRMTVGDIIGEPFEIHPEVAPQGRPRASKVQELLDVVGLNPEHINRYPHQFSGGQRQRIGIARALALQPGDHRLRRAGLRARRVGPGPGHQPAGAAAGRARPVLHLHRARPVGGPAHLRPGRGDVPRQDRRDRHRGRDLRAARRTRTPRRCSRRCRCPTRRRASSASDHPARRATCRQPGQPAVGLPLPHPLLEGAGHLRRARSRRWSIRERRPAPVAPATSPNSATGRLTAG